MNLATNLLLLYIIYFTSTYIKIATNKEKRSSHQDTRKRLEYLRDIPFKTPDQQKEFIDLKYPKTPPFKWTWKNFGILVFKLGTMLFIFFLARYTWSRFVGFEFALWQVLLIMIILPMIINKILKKYNLQQDDISIFFRKGGKSK